MTEKERILSELNVKSLETKNENKWNEQTIVNNFPFFRGIINFPLARLNDNMFSHIKTVIESIDSLDKIARKHLEENWETNEKIDFWDVLSTTTRMEQSSLHLTYVIFYSDLTFRLKYRVADRCKEEISPKNYYIGFNFTKDLTMESVFSEVYPVHINFKFSGYPLTNPDLKSKTTDIEGIIEEISVFNGKWKCADNNPNEENYAWCPQNKSICVSISLDKLRPHYKASVEYAHKNIPVNPANVKNIILMRQFNLEGVGTLRTNNIYPVRWLKKHDQENSGIISIHVKNRENFYINCEIQNYKIKQIEIIEDADTCKKLEMDIFKEDIL